MPVESMFAFYPKYALKSLRTNLGILTTYLRLRYLLGRARRDPDRLAYTDFAIAPAAVNAPALDEDDLRLISNTRNTQYARKRQERVLLKSRG